MHIYFSLENQSWLIPVSPTGWGIPEIVPEMAKFDQDSCRIPPGTSNEFTAIYWTMADSV